MADRMLGQSRKLGIRAGARQDLGVARGYRAAPFALERPREDSRSAASHARIDEAIYELDEVVWQTYSDLPAHTGMVPSW
ncbi:MAG TPA: hypothetical protein VK756_03905 [Solirubrobacteraceae bacterium]|jgi:hypothetical protein|nr:hypothetical protein [Solirubrobacteraceae bacterium]